MGFETSSPNLLCEEDGYFLNEFADNFLELCPVSESDCEFIEMLLVKETNFRPESDRRERSWPEAARSDAVKWILEKRAFFGYHYRTAYLSLIYFDRSLARNCISNGKEWNVRILSIACLSLAAKMEESKARSLREYTMEGYQIEVRRIRRMELIVLDTLEWRMIYVTPFTYLNYFATKFCGESRDEQLITPAAQLIFAIMEEINVAEHRPSTIAAAAVLAAYDHRLTKAVLENKIDVIPSWGSLEKEHTFSCYLLLQEIQELKTPKSDISLDSLSLSSDVADDSTNTWRGTRRRRLDLDNSDQHGPARKASRSNS